jgi:hypothetical protein
MERKIEHKVNGDMRTDIQYYHRIVVVAVVSLLSLSPCVWRFQKKRRRRGSLCPALLQDLERQLGRRFLDVLGG